MKNELSKTAFIIQARLGSTRLPNKIILPFYNRTNLISLLVEKLNKNFKVPLIIATTQNKEDEKLNANIENGSFFIFRGSENDVLKRFVSAAENFGVENIIRICSDNPFLSVHFLNELIDNWEKPLDYLSFSMNDGTPSILTHYGFWAEMVSLKALKRANHLLSKNDKNREHVTSFIYKNAKLFNLKFLLIPEYIQQNRNIRLTLDTMEDFELQQKIFKDLYSENALFDVPDIIRYLDSNSLILNKMKMEIDRNTK